MISPLLLSLTIALLQAPDQRPGLVKIPAGNVLLGAAKEPTLERIRKDPTNANIYAGELPRQSVRVDGFFISPTLVTNEMYLEFVQATGAIPPPSWAVISKEQRQAIIHEGQQWVDGKPGNPGYKFDEAAQAEWWAQHWQDEAQEWRMPAEIALEPVVFISFVDAQAYCEWTGLRIPTEKEWVRAARGDTDWDYPYGPEFDRTKVACNSTKPTPLAFKRLPVATFQNQSPFGVYDMVGQVLEFTDSPAVKLDGFKSFSVEVVNAAGQKEVLHPSGLWDQSRIILKGGCCQNSPVYMRIDSRFGFERTSAVNLVGFRVAASEAPFQDSAYLKCRNLRSRVLGAPPLKALDFSRTIGLEQFSTRDLKAIAAKRKAHDALAPLKMEPKLPESYAVFGPHRAITFTPLRDAFGFWNHQTLSKVDRMVAKDGRFVPLGAFCTDVPLDGHDLAPGSYTMVYLPGLKKKVMEKMGAWIKGHPKPGSEGETEEIKDPLTPSIDITNLELVPDKRYILLADDQGVAVAALPLTLAPVLKKDSGVAHGLVYDEKNDELTVHFKTAGNRGKAYGFTFRVRPKSEDGLSLANPERWK